MIGAGPLRKDSLIYVAGHNGLVGSAICRVLRRQGFDRLLLRSHAELDLADRASSETDRAIELRARDRQRKLISKIDAALQRIDDGTYGYCEETGEPISLKRLEARPIATLSIEAQERHERRERIYRDE